MNIDLGEVKQNGKRVTILVVADSYSDFVEVDFISDTRTKNVINVCKRHFARHGAPEVVVTDNGPQFDNEEWASFAKEWSFRHATSSPYHAQGNGKAESAIKSMKQLFKKCQKKGLDFWQAILQHRNSPNSVGTSPNQRLFSRDTRNAIPLMTNRLQPQGAKQVKQRIYERRQVTKASYDKKAKELPEVQAGENVFVQRRPDITSRWEKAVVLRTLPDQSCEVETEDGGVYRRSAVHVKPRAGYRKDIPPNSNGEHQRRKLSISTI